MVKDKNSLFKSENKCQTISSFEVKGKTTVQIRSQDTKTVQINDLIKVRKQKREKTNDLQIEKVKEIKIDCLTAFPPDNVQLYCIRKRPISSKSISNYNETTQLNLAPPMEKKMKTFPSVLKNITSHRKQGSSFYITTRVTQAEIKEIVNQMFPIISLHGSSPHNVTPCSISESCRTQPYPHCRWCCSMDQLANTVEHNFKVNIHGQVSDLQWSVFLSNQKNQDTVSSSGRWPPERLCTPSSCTPCQVRLVAAGNLFQFRMFK